MLIKSSYKHLTRYREIITVFIKHGFGVLLDQLGVLKYLNIDKNIIEEHSKTKLHPTAKRLRMALEELGATFIKIGQMISTRPDILTKEILIELEKLQDTVSPFDFCHVKSTIETELDDNLNNIFIEFDEKPLAAGSIAQVHLAKLKTGEQVIVKVQRPNIKNIFELDLKILEDLASFLDNHTKYGKFYDFQKTIEQFKASIINELDFTIEAKNALTFKQNFKNDPEINVPKIFLEYTSTQVLTMEYINGMSIKDLNSSNCSKFDKKLIARTITTSILNQILRDGFFHADPHPGNILVLPNNNIVFLDLGMVGIISKEKKSDFIKLLLGMVFKNSKLVSYTLINQESSTEWTNRKKLEKEVDQLVDKYLNIPLSEIKIGEVFSDLFKICFEYNIKIPKEFSTIAKSLITLEGSIEKLDPSLHILEVAQPIAKKLIFNAFSVKKAAKEILSSAFEYSNFFKDLPSFIHNFFRKLESDDFTIYFEFKNIETTLKHFDKIFNRISFGIAILSLSIIIAGIIIGTGIATGIGKDMYLFNINLLKISLVIAFLMVVLLIVAIFKSGRF